MAEEKTDEARLEGPATIVLHCILTSDGIPGWIGPLPREGSQEISWPDDFPAGVTDPVLFLAAHRRLPDGGWEKRAPPPPKSAEEVASEAAEVALADQLQAERDAEAREEEIARRAGPDALLRTMGLITIAELRARVAAIRAEVEAGN